MEKLNYRDVNEGDMDLLFEWANDPLVRQASFYSNEIQYEEHKAWFLRKISASDSMMLIFLAGEHPAGLVRFELNEGHAVIGISIEAGSRGKGYAREMLRQACQEYFLRYQNVIHAYIRLDNKASTRAFEAAGFIYSEKTKVNNIDCYLYKLYKDE